MRSTAAVQVILQFSSLDGSYHCCLCACIGGNEITWGHSASSSCAGMPRNRVIDDWSTVETTRNRAYPRRCLDSRYILATDRKSAADLDYLYGRLCHCGRGVRL